MRINNNIMAFNAQRNLGASAMDMGKSIEKLSSGLRINRAADDASGLVISQKLRAQTSGLRQATRNAQDGISVVQTAEGGLNEVHSMLNRMRDLAVQSQHWCQRRYRPSGRPTELSSSREIDRIGNNTSFGGTKLLNGSFNCSVGHRYDADGSVRPAVTPSTSLLMVAPPSLLPSMTPRTPAAMTLPPRSRTRSRLVCRVCPLRLNMPTTSA